jgi:hypothetical protein
MLTHSTSQVHWYEIVSLNIGVSLYCMDLNEWLFFYLHFYISIAFAYLNLYISI